MNIPKGYKVVPVVATLEMKNAGWRECERQGIAPEDIEMQTIWTAMHLESPAPPQPIYSALNFVCTALPGPGNECAFVELENDAGESLGHGEWRNRDDGLVELHIAAPQPIYDEAKERALFEDWYCSLDENCMPLHRPDGGRYKWDVPEHQWQSWLACAQSRANAGEETS